MAVELVTKEDLHYFRIQLLNDLKEMLSQENKQASPALEEGLKTKHVRFMLGCCYNTLQSLRVAGKLRWKKVGGTVYYNKEDVQRLLREGMQ